MAYALLNKLGLLMSKITPFSKPMKDSLIHKEEKITTITIMKSRTQIFKMGGSCNNMQTVESDQQYFKGQVLEFLRIQVIIT